MARLLFSEKLAVEAPSPLPFPNNHNFDPNEFPTSIMVCLMGIMMFFIFFQFMDKLLRNWLQNETSELDAESEDDGDHRPLADRGSYWSPEATEQNHVLMLQILNGFMALSAHREGPYREDLERSLPLVIYKSIGRQTPDECVICLEDFEDDELCRVFPVCNHVFHFNCIDSWLRDNMTCPTCRNCISFDE